MSMLDLLLSIGTQYDLALLPLLALALLPSLTSALGTVGGGLAATALGAGLGAGQGAIISAATGQKDIGMGALKGAGSGALGAGLGSVASAAAPAAEAASTGAQAAQSGAEAAQAATAAVEPAATGAQSAVSAAELAPEATSAFDAATALGPEASQVFGTGTGTFAQAPQGALQTGPTLPPDMITPLREGAAGAQVAGATKDVSIAESLGKAAKTLGPLMASGTSQGIQGAQRAAQAGMPPKEIRRMSLPKAGPRMGPAPLDPVAALLMALKQRQMQKIQSRTFF